MTLEPICRDTVRKPGRLPSRSSSVTQPPKPFIFGLAGMRHVPSPLLLVQSTLNHMRADSAEEDIKINVRHSSACRFTKMHTVKGYVVLKMQLIIGTGEAGVGAASMVGLTPCLRQICACDSSKRRAAQQRDTRICISWARAAVTRAKYDISNSKDLKNSRGS